MRAVVLSSSNLLQVTRYKNNSVYNSGAIQFVNSSSDSDFESLSPTNETFTRNNRSREGLRRKLRKGSLGSSSSNSSDSLKPNKCDDDKEKDFKRKYEYNQKELVIQGLKKTVDDLNRKLQIRQYENTKLVKENEDLREQTFKVSLKLSDIEDDLSRSSEREEGLKFMVARLTNIVQAQDEEIARLHLRETAEKTGALNADAADKIKDLEKLLRQAETKLLDQQEVNQQLKRYLEMLVLKLC